MISRIELEELIKNKQMIWVVRNERILKRDTSDFTFTYYYEDSINFSYIKRLPLNKSIQISSIVKFEEIYKTELEAKQSLKCKASRVETLNLPSFESVKKEYGNIVIYSFICPNYDHINKNGCDSWFIYRVLKSDADRIMLTVKYIDYIINGTEEIIFDEKFTIKNYNKLCDICNKLFLEE